jgi:hypothetical protein
VAVEDAVAIKAALLARAVSVCVLNAEKKFLMSGALDALN